MRTHIPGYFLIGLLCLGYSGPACVDPRVVDPTDPDWDGDGFPESEDCYDCRSTMQAGCNGPTVICEEAHPGATEYCNGIDDDCDGERDEDTVDTNSVEEQDEDGDGWTDPDNVEAWCDSSEYWEPIINLSFGCSSRIRGSGDCNDSDREIHPQAPEVCDEVDNDCDGDVDETAPTSDWWYEDFDDDGFGDPATATQACGPPDGYVGTSGDCDDEDPDVSPGASEVCDDGIDQDCDGFDEACGDDDDAGGDDDDAGGDDDDAGGDDDDSAP